LKRKIGRPTGTTAEASYNTSAGCFRELPEMLASRFPVDDL